MSEAVHSSNPDGSTRDLCSDAKYATEFVNSGGYEEGK